MKHLFNNKSALITGASSGLGRSLSISLSAHCKKLFLTGRDYENLKKTASQCAKSCEVEIIAADLTSSEGLYSLILAVNSNVDILLNVAGVFPLVPLAQTSDFVFDECISLNVTVPFVLSRELSKGMVKRGWGRIINIGSSSSYAGSEASGAYCASKHALLGLTRSLFLELRNTGVRVQFIAPGSLQTPMGKSDYRQNYDTFIDPDEAATFIAHAMEYDSEMISEEIRLNRILIQ